MKSLGGRRENRVVEQGLERVWSKFSAVLKFPCRVILLLHVLSLDSLLRGQLHHVFSIYMCYRIHVTYKCVSSNIAVAATVGPCIPCIHTNHSNVNMLIVYSIDAFDLP